MSRSQTPRRLGPWPRRLAMLVTAMSMAAGTLFDVLSRQHGHVDLGHVLQVALPFGLLGAPLALLARPRDTNPWRTSGVWATLLAYGGTTLAQVVYEWQAIAKRDTRASAWFMLLMLVAWGLAGLDTLVASAVTAARSWHQPRPPTRLAVSGRQLGATALAAVLVVLGLLLALPAETVARLTPRAVAVLLGYVLGAVLLVVGTVLQARQGRRTLPATGLLWGAVTLLAGVAALDSFARTSLSGMSGDFPYSSTPYRGFGPFVLPAGVVALVGVLGGGPPASQDPEPPTR